MCYLVAKKRLSHGSYALKIRQGKHLVELKEKLNSVVNGCEIQLVTISRPSAYGEYAPYKIIDEEKEFEQKVISLKECNICNTR